MLEEFLTLITALVEMLAMFGVIQLAVIITGAIVLFYYLYFTEGRIWSFL